MTAAVLGPIGNLGDHAREYAAAGLEVFPVEPATKAPLTAHGMHDASDNQEQVTRWWAAHPAASIGCRVPSGVVVIDIDPRHGGAATWRTLLDDYLAESLITTRAHYSGRGDGGGHVWFLCPWTAPDDEGHTEPIKLSIKRLDDWAKAHGTGEAISDTRHVSGIDLLTHEHRYTILPPSIHAATDQPYRWRAGGLSVAVAPMPGWLVHLLTPDVVVPPPVSVLGEAREGLASGATGGDGFSIAQWFTDTHTWRDVLGPADWTCRGDGDTDGSSWLHPRATSASSATITHGCLFVYSPNTPFEVTSDGDPHGYTRFAAWALLNFGGNQQAAGRAARELLYGPRSPDVDPYELAPPEPTQGHTEPPHRARMIGGGAFILDAPESVPALWGLGDEVLWAAGEPFYIVGPAGVGKTTLMGQLLWGRLGLLDEVLGYPVAKASERILYLASDRPQQIARGLRRLANEEQRAMLDDRLVIWRGPPPTDIARVPGTLMELCREAGADTVIMDSLKDMAVGISQDEVGAGFNAAVQLCIAEGVDVGGLHHQRKSGNNEAQPKTLADVYGSTWITAGAGSVVLLWATEAGSATVQLIHLKQPAGVVGPLNLEHDHLVGLTRVVDAFDLWGYFARHHGPATAEQIAQAEHGKAPAKNARRTWKRRLDVLVAAGKLVKIDGGKASDGLQAADLYRRPLGLVDALAPSPEGTP